jgi:putative ABC transport system ATP-binding protein
MSPLSPENPMTTLATPEPVTTPQPGTIKRSPLITLDRITKSFTTRGAQPSLALRGVSLTIEAGEYVAVLGKSGSGKSTLLNLIAGLDQPSSGAVTVAGSAIASMNESRIARWRGEHIGVVFQFFQLLPTLTALENIVLAMELVGRIPPAKRRGAALELLAMVNLADHAHKLPSTLSGGQQQRAAIARALANDPPILLADEPTGNLDTETANDVSAVFQQLAARGTTLLIVTHDVALARSAHRVLEIKDGLVIADNRNPAADGAHI